MDSSVIEQAICRYGTPLYLHDGEKIEFQFKTLKDSLPSSFEIFFSIKANPLLGICQLLAQMGSKAEAASIGEINIALSSGYSSSDIIFTSPGKNDREIEFAIDKDIYCINIESLEEAILINEIACNKSKKVNIAIRVNPDFNYSNTEIKMGGVPTQFGIDQSQIEPTFKLLNTLNNIKVIGIHVYTGTQILNADNIILNTEETIKLALHISEKFNFQLEFLDLGGGFGIPYFTEDIELDMNKLKHGMSTIWSKYKQKLSNTRVAIESGRFLVADSGIYITKILYKKECKGKKFLICDGGYSQHPSAIFLGRTKKNRFPIRVLYGSSEKEKINIVGPSCTPIDIIGNDIIIDKAFPGNYILVEKSGAYGLTNSPILFLSHPSASEVIYYNGDLHLLRNKGSIDDLLCGQNKLF